ncbi:MAG: WYL domain-containing protein, partial [Polyangia bacterium]
MEHLGDLPRTVRLERLAVVDAQNCRVEIHVAHHAPGERLEDVNDITTALLREERLRVRHDSVDNGKPSFVIEPYTLLIYKKGVYLVAKSQRHDAI